LTDWQIELPPDPVTHDYQLTLRELIERIVSEELQAFGQRQLERRLPSVLSPNQIQQGVLAGKVDMGGREQGQTVNPQEAVANALRGFRDGIYYVFVDGTQQQDLDQTVRLRNQSELTFLRLVPLAGG
jgi:hypothetical protein